MLIPDLCVRGLCDASFAQNRYVIVKENPVCVSTVLPTKDSYHPGRLYAGIQPHLDIDILGRAEGKDFLSEMGTLLNQIAEGFCRKDVPEIGARYLTVRLLHARIFMPAESERTLTSLAADRYRERIGN